MRLATALVVAAGVVVPVSARAGDPPVPLGQDPGGPAIAVITTGVDYTVPAIAARLARDGEGELIGWDLVDNDPKPFGAALVDLASLTPTSHQGEFRIVPVRIDPANPMAFAAAIAFVARTPARLAVITTGPMKRANWAALRQAVMHFKTIAIDVDACGPPRPASVTESPDDIIGAESVDLGEFNVARCPK